jgi:hypothetical protein
VKSRDLKEAFVIQGGVRYGMFNIKVEGGGSMARKALRVRRPLAEDINVNTTAHYIILKARFA